MNTDSKFRSRKFYLALLFFVASTGMLWGGYISESIWRDMMMFIGGSYFLANFGDKKVAKQ